MRGSRALLAVAVAGCLVGGCTPTSEPAHHDSPTRTTQQRAVEGPLTPSIPAVFRSGTNACGDPYAITATKVGKTIALESCAGLVGLQPLPVMTVRQGAELRIAGLPASAYLTLHPPGLLRARGTTFRAVGRGITVVTVHGAQCGPSATQTRHTSCPLLEVRTA